MSDLIVRHTQSEMVASLAAYLPGGELFQSAFIPGTNFNALLTGLSGELLRAENVLFLYNSQFIPDETTVFIEEWESALGIPDDCFTVSPDDTNEQRRINILVKMASLGVQTADDFVNLADILGFPNVAVLPGVGSDDDSIVNGTFDTDSDWTKGTGWTIFAGTANHLTGAAGDLSQDITAVPGTLYLVTYDVLFTDTGAVTPTIGGTAGVARSENGSYQEVIVSGASDTLLSMVADNSFNGSVDNIVVNGSLAAGTTPRFTIVVIFSEIEVPTFPLTFPIPFGDTSVGILECLFTKLKPANCDIVFVIEAVVPPPVFLKSFSWGNNGSGQLGLGDTTTRSSPVQIGAENDWATISAGNNFVLATKTDGSAFAWGDNVVGGLGVGDTTSRSSPVQVGVGTDWETLSAGSNHSLGIQTDGTAFAWGNNNAGQLGFGDTISVSSPVQIGSDTDWAQMSAGSTYSLAIKTDGRAFAWGLNGSGVLGLGDTSIRSSPVQIGTDTDWAQIAAGTNHSMAIKEDGTAWSWGNNGSGQLGLGDVTSRSSPVQIGTDTDWAYVECGDGWSLALKTDGTAHSWGTNGNGELGQGDTTSRSSPVQIGTDTDWAFAANGNDFGFLVKTDKRAFAWGRNISGQLGLGDTTTISSPVQIGSDENWSIIKAGVNYTVGLVEEV